LTGRILVPVNGSARSNETLLSACKAAEAMKGGVIALYVIVLPLTIPLVDLPEEIDREGRSILRQASQAARSEGFTVATRLVRARDVATTIVSEAIELGVDFIFMAPDRHRPLWRTWFTPRITEHVVRNALCPVVVGEGRASFQPPLASRRQTR
jgi:nucleotide-binding universal stress UspA family protein